MAKQLLQIIFLLLVSGTGCTDNGSPQASTSLSDDAGTPSVNAINGDLTGEIWVTDRFGTERYNLETGKTTEVSSELAYPIRDGSLFVEILYDYTKVRDRYCMFYSSNDAHQVNVKNTRTGAVTGSFLIDKNFSGPLRLSPDGERVALYVAEQDPHGCGFNYKNERLTVFSKEGKQLFRDDTGRISGFDFDPEGRLVLLGFYSSGDYYVKAESYPGSYRFGELLTFTSAPGVRFYRGFRVGPKNKDAVVEAVYATPPGLSGIRYRDARVHHFSLIEKFGETDLFEQEDDDRVNSPAFSPDGKHIVVTEGYASGALVSYNILSEFEIVSGTTVVPEVIPVKSGSISYVVPVELRNQPMPPAQYSKTFRPVLNMVSQPGLASTGTVRTMGFNPIWGLSWTPTIVPVED